MFQYLATLLAVLSSFILSCNPTKTPDASEKIVIGTDREPDTLDPRHATDMYSIRICRLIYDGLFKTDDQLNIVPHLAARYTVEDNRVYNIWLRSGVSFHDGTELSLSDVVATYRYILNQDNKSPYYNSFKFIEKMDIVGDHQLRITLNEPYSPFLTALNMGIVPERFEKEKPFIPIGSGPYRFSGKDNQSVVTLKQFEQHFAGKAGIKIVQLKPVLEESVRLLELLKGSIDIVQNGLPASMLDKAAEHPEVTIDTSTGLAYAYLGLNLKDPLLSNLKVRQALAYAINRDDIIEYQLKNQATKAESLLTPAHYMAAKDLPNHDFDIEKAKRLLDEAGYKDPDGDGEKTRFQLSYKTSTNPERLEIAHIISDQLKKVGVDVKLQSMEFGVFFKDIKSGNFQLYSLEWSGVTSPDIYHYVFHSASVPPEGANRGFYSNSEVDKLVTQARHITDLEKQKVLYQRVQQILAEELPYISLWHRHNIVAARKRVQTYQVTTVADYQGLPSATLTAAP